MAQHAGIRQQYFNWFRQLGAPALQEHAALRNVHDEFHATVCARRMSEKCAEHGTRLAHAAIVGAHHVKHEMGQLSGMRAGKTGHLLADLRFVRAANQCEAEVAVGAAGTTQDQLYDFGPVGFLRKADSSQKSIACLTIERPELGAKHAGERRHSC